MILFDINVVSELMLQPSKGDPNFTNYFAAQILTDLHLPGLVVAEIRYGIEKLPAGKRRVEIERSFQDLLELGFSARIISFNADCAIAYAIARITRQKIGRPVSTETLSSAAWPSPTAPHWPPVTSTTSPAKT